MKFQKEGLIVGANLHKLTVCDTWKYAVPFFHMETTILWPHAKREKYIVLLVLIVDSPPGIVRTTMRTKLKFQKIKGQWRLRFHQAT